METESPVAEQRVVKRLLTRKQVAKIPLSEEEHQKLIVPPRASLKNLKEGTQCADDWYIVTFRIRVGLMAAKREYSDEVCEVLEEADRVTREMHAAYQINDKYNWSCSVGQIQVLEQGLDLVDEIQRMSSRETLMFVTRKVYSEMRKFAED